MPTAFEKSMQSIQKMRQRLQEAEQDINAEFLNLFKSDEINLMINPEMLSHCRLEWVQQAVTAHETPPPGTEYKDLIAVLEQNAKPQPMSEPDAKTVLALIQHVERKIDAQLMIKMQSILKTARMECDLIREAKITLNRHAHETIHAMTLGIGNHYNEEWIGRYGTTRTAENTPAKTPWTGGYGR